MEIMIVLGFYNIFLTKMVNKTYSFLKKFSIKYLFYSSINDKFLQIVSIKTINFNKVPEIILQALNFTK